MKIFKTFCLTIGVFFSANAQDLIKKIDFTVRDFITTGNDSMVFIKKRNVYINSNKKSKEYFIGGYGLELFYDKKNNQIITASNELVENVSSVRFYNLSKNKVEDVFYYKKGKILDFLKIPDLNVFVLSLTNKKIIFVNFDEKPKFLKVVEIELNALSRRVLYHNNTVYYTTDIGEIYRYNLSKNKNELIYKDSNTLITDFSIMGNNILYATIDGVIIKINTITHENQKLKINNNFITNSLKFNNKLICGSWNGEIYVIDITDFSIEKTFKYHSRGIMKIVNNKDHIFYSSSLDKTIKKWILN